MLKRLLLKKMLVNNVLIPTISYGSEAFGINKSRIQKIKTVVDKSLSHIVHCKNFPRVRLYEELDIKPLQIRTTENRIRGYLKWGKSNGTIKELIDSSITFKSKKGTWCKSSRKWMKRFNIGLENTFEVGKKEVTDCLVKIIKRNDKTETSAFANALNIGSGKLLRKIEINNKAKAKGVNDLLKIRTGTFFFTNRLIKYGKIDQIYYNRCLCCKEQIKEDPKHLFLECAKFKNERKIFLKINASIYNGWDPPVQANQTNILSLILGGDCPASGKMPSERIINSINYLSSISKKREAIIAEFSLMRS